MVNEALAVTATDIGRQFHGNILDLVLDSGPMVQFVLLLLFFFSVLSWAIIIVKYRVVRRTKKENALFLQVYMRSTKLSAVFPESRKFRSSTLAEVFRAGYTELGKVTRAMKESSQSAESTEEGILSMDLRGIDNVERALNRACDAEISKIEQALVFLATTGSASPFIGLFGTVWGIMNAFRGIGVRGSATLAVVAPGISEALVATAAGLAAAIPAVIFYNYFLNRIKDISLETESFASEFLNIIERFYVRSSS
ncbi:MAG: protein TolQ [Deltaproteobacteria bacterium]|nr:protein TolQ [Deltaproteobacteria bacterium]